VCDSVHTIAGIDETLKTEDTINYISFNLFNIPQIPSAIHSDVDVEIVLIIK
jgi:hypothetical protein